MMVASDRTIGIVGGENEWMNEWKIVFEFLISENTGNWTKINKYNVLFGGYISGSNNM